MVKLIARVNASDRLSADLDTENVLERRFALKTLGRKVLFAAATTIAAIGFTMVPAAAAFAAEAAATQSSANTAVATNSLPQPNIYLMASKTKNNNPGNKTPNDTGGFIVMAGGVLLLAAGVGFVEARPFFPFQKGAVAGYGLVLVGITTAAVGTTLVLTAH